MKLYKRKGFQVIAAVSALVILVILLVAYREYREIKVVLIGKIESETTARIGQRVTIGDISVFPLGEFTLKEITIHNPQGFGQLLRVKRLSILADIGALLKRQLHVTRISIHAPVLTIMKDSQGNLNISDTLRQFLTQKSTRRYQVDQVRIDSGALSFYGSEWMSMDALNLTLKDLSSQPGTKTEMKGSLRYAGRAKAAFEGVVQLNDPAKRFAGTLSADAIPLTEFRTLFGEYGAMVKNASFSLRVNAAGDTEKGVALNASAILKDAKFRFLTRTKKTTLTADAFFDIKKRILVADRITLQAGDRTALLMRGMLSGIPDNLSYTATASFNDLDLSLINFSESFTIKGRLSSDAVMLTGKPKAKMHLASGTMRLREGSFSAKPFHAEAIAATLKFSSQGGLAITGEGTAALHRLKEITFRNPLALTFSTEVRPNKTDVTLISKISTAPTALILKGKNLLLDHASIEAEGTLQDGSFSGKGAISTPRIGYGEFNLSNAAGTLVLVYGKETLTIKDLALQSKEMQLSAPLVRVAFPKGLDTASITTERVNVRYQPYQIEVKGMAAQVSPAESTPPMRHIAFNAESLSYQGIDLSDLQGKATLSQKAFTIDLLKASVFGGAATAQVDGTFAQNAPFPLNIRGTAENVALDKIAKALPSASSLAGGLTRLSFNGTIASVRDISGNAEVKGKGISFTDAGSTRPLFKGAEIALGLGFRGKDTEVKGLIALSQVSASISGKISGLMSSSRTAALNVHLPEVKAAVLRESLWDSFPDALLYAGLEGSLSADLALSYASNAFRVQGRTTLKNFKLTEENGAYSLGPANGTIPILYSSTPAAEKELSIPAFEKAEFNVLKKRFSQANAEKGFERVTLGSFRYGFKLFDNITLTMRQQGDVLEIGQFSADTFGGKLQGMAALQLTKGIPYRAGFILNGLSLNTLSNEIEPIKGYISGKVDGITMLKGNGASMAKILGKADFWTYSAGGEKMRISKELLQKLGGPQLKMYLRERSYDKGIMSIYVKDGFMIFNELEISNRNFFGMKDLSIQVAPLSNRISIDQLLWSITQAAERAKAENKGSQIKMEMLK